MECLNEEERQMRKHPNHGHELVRGGEMVVDKFICPLGCGLPHESQEELDKHMEYVKKFNIDDTKRVRAKNLLDGVCF